MNKTNVIANRLRSNPAFESKGVVGSQGGKILKHHSLSLGIQAHTTRKLVGSFCKVQDDRRAFTLAEVLITLGIIGIVAAMTMPTLIGKYKEKETVTKLQKVYSIFAQAFDRARVDYGDFGSWTLMPSPDSAERTLDFWDNYGFPYLNIIQKCVPTSGTCFSESARGLNGSTGETDVRPHRISFVLNDGTSVLSWVGGSDNPNNMATHVCILVDINGTKAPNILGKDIFYLYFSPNPSVMTTFNKDEEGNTTEPKEFTNNSYGFYGETLPLKVEELLDGNLNIAETPLSTGGKSSCSLKGNGLLCGAAIKANGWKIPKGYPVGF